MYLYKPQNITCNLYRANSKPVIIIRLIYKRQESLIQTKNT